MGIDWKMIYGFVVGSWVANHGWELHKLKGQAVSDCQKAILGRHHNMRLPQILELPQFTYYNTK